MRYFWKTSLFVLLSAGLLLSGCKDDSKKDGDKTDDKTKQEAPEIKTDKGVDLENKTIHIGGLYDLSGPASSIGKPFAGGKQLLAERINAGGVLPKGWQVELHEEDHKYNQTKASQAYKKIKDDVLFVGTSFGTPPTMAILPQLEKDGVVAFPASLSTQMAENEHTPPLGPTYKFEAMRAFDYALEDAGGKDELKPAIVHLKNDYGKDVIDGWKQAAEAHGVDIVAEQAISPQQKDMTSVVNSLKEAGANYVMLGILPNGTAPLLGKAAQMKYAPTWLGATPAWTDSFFLKGDKAPVPQAGKVFANFKWVSGLPYWGEELPGMEAFVKAFEEHLEGDHRRDFYILVSYIQGLVQAEILERCIEDKDLTRANFLEQMHSIEDFDAGGLIQPVDLSDVPYVVGTEIRVLSPDFEGQTWNVTSDWAEPEAYDGGSEGSDEGSDGEESEGGGEEGADN